jgi:RimJ/RimL family protein N-acetyltransferase
MRHYKKIQGEKVYLSPIHSEDIEKMTEWLSDIEISRGLSMAAKIITLESGRASLQSVDSDFFSIVTQEGDRLIGTCGYWNTDGTQRQSEVIMMIGERNNLGKGYGTEAMKLLLEFGFNIRNLHSIRLRVYSFNKRGIRSYEKCGFKHAGCFREAGRIDGEYYDEILMDILEDEYRALKGK